MSDAPSWAARYRVIEKLGAGSMGVVYRAEHLPLKREVALKTLLGSLESTEELLERFRREAVGLSAVNHPGLAKVFEVSGPGEDPYLAMELVRGPTLEEAAAASPVAIRRQGDALFLGIAEAMAAVHAARLMHRDLKPANVMLANGERPVVMDLGLVKDAAGRWGKMTSTGIVVGTPAYLAPELVRGEAATFRSDVWALGAVYFFLHAGVPPFRAASTLLLAQAICTDPLPDLDVACADLPGPQRRFLLWLLQRDAARRPADAGAVVAAFRDVLRGHATPARTAGQSGQRTKRLRRAPLVAWALGAGAVAGLAAFALRRPPAPIAPVSVPAAVAPLRFIDGAHPPAAPLFTRWRALAAYRGRLRTGGDVAAVQELRRVSPVNLGTSAEPWRHWLDLGAWLDQPSGHWSDDHPVNTSIANLQAALLYSALWQTQVASPRILAVVLDATLFAPRDAAAWLVLGTLLEDEGAVAQAQAAYREALYVLGTGAIASEAPVPVWRGLARALSVVPGHTLEREWRQHLPRGMAHRRPWRGLQLAGERGVVRRLLRAAEEREQPAASAVLGADFDLYDQDPEAARQHWEGLEVLRVNAEVEAAQHEHWLTRGSLANPRDPVPAEGLDELLAGPPRELRPWREPPRSREPRRPARLVRLLEARALAEAREEGERQVNAGVLPPGALCAELARAGDVSPANDRACRALVDSFDASWSDLDRMAGSLAAPVVAPWFGPRLEREPAPAVGGCARLAVALWLSRSDRHAEAVGALGALVGASHVREQHGEALTEIYGRPLWQRLAERHPDPVVLARLPGPERPPAILHRRSAELWRALRDDERARALAAAKDGFDALPRAVSSQLALVYAAAAAPDRAAGRALVEQVRAGARFQGAPLWVLDEIERAGRR